MNSPFLQASYAPVRDEIDVTGLAVTGELPPGLNGVFLRNGPNPVFEPQPPYRWFGGDGMVHGIWLSDGRANRYRNRWVKTFGLGLERRVGHSLFPTLGIPKEPVPEAVARGEMVKNAANTHIIAHGGKLLCLFESGEPYELDDELETVGAYRYGGRLQGPMTAHPKVDPATGNLHFFGYAPFEPWLRYHCADRAGELVASEDVTLPRPVMMHDFAITDEAAVFLDSPLVFDLPQAMQGGAAFRWLPEHGMRLGILPFDDPGAVRWYDVPDTGFAFHTYNAWREGEKTVLVCGRKEKVQFDGGPPKDPESLWRYTIDPASGRVTSELLNDLHAVLPRIDERLTGRPSRYGYAAGILGHRRMIDWDALVRFDLVSGAHEAYQYPAGFICGEPVFAPDPARSGELDGWVLQLVQDPDEAKTDLCLFRAEDIGSGPVARVHLPQVVPNGFHGSWVPDEG